MSHLKALSFHNAALLKRKYPNYPEHHHESTTHQHIKPRTHDPAGRAYPCHLSAEQSLKDIVERHGFDAQFSISVKIKHLACIEPFNKFIMPTYPVT